MDASSRIHHHNFRTLSKKRTTNFREDETKLLIQLWGSPQIQNKLYLTHRKEPVMRILAAGMQQRGFYRTPDEIKTRIRNLKCLYHRIKRTVQSGAGIGTVDPDWPHYAAMDGVLSKQHEKKERLYRENVFEGPRFEDIKQEILDEEVDINDDMDSLATGSEMEEDLPSVRLPTLTPAPKKSEIIATYKPKSLPKILPNLAPIPLQKPQQNSLPSIPFPLLILNGIQANQANSILNNKKTETKKENGQPDNKNLTNPAINTNFNSDTNTILKELLEVQKQHLSVEKQRLELEKQKLEFERFLGSQFLAMGPIMGSLFQKFSLMQPEAEQSPPSSPDESISPEKNTSTTPPTSKKRECEASSSDVLRNTKFLKMMLSEGIRKYMMGEDSENEDSGIQDENSNS